MNDIVKVCKKCNQSERYVSGKCAVCSRNACAERHIKNKSSSNEKSKLWRKNNPEKVKENFAKWYELNKVENLVNRKEYREKNAQKIKLDKTAYRKKNPEKIKTLKANRRARVKHNGGILTPGIIDKLYQLQSARCPCCNKPLGTDFQLDHIMPLALGGSNTDNNVQLLRSRCNHQKHARHPIEFMQSRGFLL